MKRTGTLVASIFAIVMDAFAIAFNIFLATAFIDLITKLSVVEPVIILQLVLSICFPILFLIVGAILTCFTFKCFRGSSEEYERTKKVLIASITFNFIIIITLFYGLASTIGITGIIIASVLTVFYITSNVLYIVDLSLEKKRDASLTTPNETSKPTETAEE